MAKQGKTCAMSDHNDFSVNAYKYVRDKKLDVGWPFNILLL